MIDGQLKNFTVTNKILVVMMNTQTIASQNDLEKQSLDNESQQSTLFHSSSSSTDKPIKIIPGALVCCQPEDFITCPNSGPIYIGEKTIIHPKCVIESGPNSGGIYIGQHNVIEEKVHIINYSAHQLFIGNFNWIQSGCTIQGTIGSRNTIEPKVQVMKGSSIADDCHIGALCIVQEKQTIENNTSIYGHNCEQVREFNPDDPHTKMLQEQHITMMNKQIDILSKIMSPLSISMRNKFNT
jgi:carbonic anhydrase/acetyltransferase-like protein (isoleucine patch superfamily)